jgi:hypothetical protein
MGDSPEVNSSGSRPLLVIAALLMLAAAGAVLISPPEMGIVRTAPDAPLLAARIARHPTDWPAVSALAEVALDTRLENRDLLWHAAYAHAALLAPERTDPVKAFVRAGFFHWTELSEVEKQEVMTACAALLRNPVFFHQMARPIFELTGDLSFLQRSGPPTADATAWLISIALPNGRFADYRALRSHLRQQRLSELTAQLHTGVPEELVARFPGPPYHSDAEPLIQSLLDELHQRPLVENPNRPDVLDAVVDYALRHNLGPLDGLEVISRIPGAASVQAQIKLARQLGINERATQLEMASNDPRRVLPNDYEWQGLCQSDVCTRAWRMVDAEHGIALMIENTKTDEVPAYVEIYVDDALLAEGEVGSQRELTVPAGYPGAHRIEVVLANPRTRNQSERRVHIASVTAL